MGQVEVVKTEDGIGQAVLLSEGGSEYRDEERFASALRGCEANDERRRSLGGRVLRSVSLVEVEDEWDHILGFVILDAFRYDCCCHGSVYQGMECLNLLGKK